jgi:hypothetical protein
MGRNVVEATKAWRIRRTRGDMGRLCLFAVVVRVCVPGFLVLPAGLFDLTAAEDFTAADL